MPATTTGKNLPYPLGTDRVMDGDDAIRKLAQSVDNMVQGGFINVNVVTGGSSSTATLTFPVAFGGKPTVVVCMKGSAANTNIQCSVDDNAATPTSVPIGAVRATSGTQGVQWIAIGPVAAVS